MKIDFHDKIDYINKYTTPVMNVVAVEVKKDEVDNVYMELKVAIDNMDLCQLFRHIFSNNII